MKDSTKMLIRLGVYGITAGVTGYAGVKMATPYLRTTLKEEKGGKKTMYLKTVVIGAGLGMVAAATGLTLSDIVIDSIENSSNKQPLITSKDE